MTPIYVAVREVECASCRYRKLLFASAPLVCPRNLKHGEMRDVAITGTGPVKLVDVCPDCGLSLGHDGPDDEPLSCPACDAPGRTVEMRIVAVVEA